ncbi:MAG: nucleoside deaminase [Flavobacteriales bacterium]
MEKDTDHSFFMKQALKEAQRALEQDEVPVGAVIVFKNTVIGRGHNLTEKLTDFTAHAEMQAFTAASHYLNNKYLNECTLYVTLEPCVMCAGASFWTQTGHIVFGAYDEKRGYSKLSNNIIHPKTKITGGVMAEECGVLLTNFFKRKRESK